MATDRKSQHYTSAQNYVDNDGLSKTFTMIDHDKKSKTSMLTVNENDINNAKQELKEYRKQLQERILSIPASLAPDIYFDFTVRGSDTAVIKWNETMIRNEGIDLDRLRSLAVILENTVELHRIIL